MDGAVLRATHDVVGVPAVAYTIAYSTAYSTACSMVDEVRSVVASCIEDDMVNLLPTEDSKRIVAFNDNVGTDQSSVLEVLQKAVKKVEDE